MFYSPELDENFDTKEEMLTKLKANKSEIITKKKSVIKRADAFAISSIEGNTKEVLSQLKQIAIKASNPFNKSVDYMKEVNLPNILVKAVTNTTNWFDSHRDCHIDGIWNKTISDNKTKGFPHLQEHERDFEAVISDSAKTFIQNTTFRALGFEYGGATQALRIESSIDPNRNLFMYNQYANGWVKNHSVGMQYVTILFCANSEMESMKEEKANWDKYYPVIANKDDVDQVGYFWAVTEAKLIEHSAVVFGSNKITPTESVEIEADKSLPLGAEKSLPPTVTKFYHDLI